MRRFTPLAVVLALIATGCEEAGPLEPSSVTSSSASTTNMRNDSTPSPSGPGTAAAEGGIMMGSGT